MNEIAIGMSARASLSSLQAISGQMAKVQKRLATGQRVNSPTDDPTAYFTASSLRSRAATLNSLVDGIATAQKTIEAANAGIATIESLLNSAKSLASQALQSPAVFVEITGTRATSMTTATQIASSSGSSTRFKAGDQITVSDGTTVATYTAVNNDTVQTFLDAINNTANLQVDASLDANGQIVLEASTNVNVTIGATMDGAGGATLHTVIGHNAGTTNYVTNTARQSYAQQFDALLDQIDQAVLDAGYNGNNLLAGGDLDVVFNETGTSRLTLTGGAFGASDLGVADSVGDFQLDAYITAAEEAVSDALLTVQTQSTLYASNSAIIDTRQTFSKSMAATLLTGADEMVATDTDEDAAILLALQTRQQMAATLLSLTQDEARGTLRLFGL